MEKRLLIALLFATHCCMCSLSCIATSWLWEWYQRKSHKKSKQTKKEKET